MHAFGILIPKLVWQQSIVIYDLTQVYVWQSTRMSQLPTIYSMDTQKSLTPTEPASTSPLRILDACETCGKQYHISEYSEQPHSILHAEMWNVESLAH